MLLPASLIIASLFHLQDGPRPLIVKASRCLVPCEYRAIFEGSAEADCLRLLVGKLPQSRFGPAVPSISQSLPLSSHYATLLADLAHQRGFDGYLLNFECPLRGAVQQTKALAAWVTVLKSELEAKIGPHAQAVWYDSVVFTGELRWQDRLNNFNLPFFLSSTSIFTNYTWPPHYPSLTAQYFSNLDPVLIGMGDSNPHKAPKSLQDIFVGVDVWGRGSHGDGGFGCYKAISHIAPDSLGLSVALFGPAWTWESEQDKPGWTWDAWWAYERRLWVGPPVSEAHIPENPPPECPHGPFQSLTSFFDRAPPPNPSDLTLHTNFCPGVGFMWFVDGVKVTKTHTTWTDIDKQNSLGDMVWPRPVLAWEGDQRAEDVPATSAEICMDEAWNGGSSLRLGLTLESSASEDAFFRCVWAPVQSLPLTPGKLYEATAVYKIESSTSANIDLNLGLSVKLLSNRDNVTAQVTPDETQNISLKDGWTSLHIQFEISDSSEADYHSTDMLAAIGLVIGIVSEDPTHTSTISILLGQMNIFCTPPPTAEIYQPSIIWADFERIAAATPSSVPVPDRLQGTLTWDTAASFSSTAPVIITYPDNPVPPWTLDPSDRWFPRFLYFNVYVQRYAPSRGAVGGPQSARWIGTSSIASRFVVDVDLGEVCKGDGVEDAGGVRFFVQGFTDRGKTLSWDRCVFVDHDFRSA